MPYVFKHRRPPEPWNEIRKNALHDYLIPLYYANWIGEWVAYFLARWSIVEVLEYVGSFSILVAVIFYFADAGDRLKQKHYQAWQVINTAQGKGGNGGRIEAVQQLNEDHVSLVGVDLADSYLQEVKLIGADLRRSNLRGADLKKSVFHKSDLEDSDLHSANLRGADLSSTNLSGVDLDDSDLTESRLDLSDLHGAALERADLRNADLRGVRDWAAIKSIRLANIHGVKNAPEGFAAWAKKAGAVDMTDDVEWNRAIEKSRKAP